ncbi:pentapeptide repeat-containing protein [Mesorhizobium australicum]|uniref:pentapeptide repeat-containing protein n=1 Tax=Mesorhizobium australicum TaxID=536018 RepID=UPI000A1CD01B|nr:pentapeptide repeat-containing protein [Mesorhizobium australicum]
MRLAAGRDRLDAVDFDMTGSVFDDVNLTGARFHNVKLQDVTIEESCVAGLRINGILVTELLETYEAAKAAGGK